MAKLEEHVDNLDRTINDFTQDRRRQSDQTNELLRDIESKINGMQGFSNGVKWTVGIFFAMIGGVIALTFNKIFGVHE